MNLLPIDLPDFIGTELERQRRENDGLLHASSHLTGSLRHAQLDVAGAPRRSESVVSMTRMWLGTMTHEWLAERLRKQGVPFMSEVALGPWMPKGWGGTADAFIWNPEYKAFVLVDFKTTKGESMRYVIRDGAKVEHKAQVSLYWHAAKRMGIPLAKAVAVLYVPVNDTRSKAEIIEPTVIDFEPLPASELHKEARRRHKRVEKYLESLPQPNPRPLAPEEYVTDALEPAQAREQRIFYDRATETWDVRLTPHWSASYCPYEAPLCTCHELRPEKIGTVDVDGVTYYARKGYESIALEVDLPGQ